MKLIAGSKATAHHCSFHPMNGDTVAILEADLAERNEPRDDSILSSCRPAATLVRKLVKARIAEG
jgi:hypothetical protein